MGYLIMRRVLFTLIGIGTIILAVWLIATSSPEEMKGFSLLLATISPQVRASIWRLILVIVLITLGGCLTLSGFIPRQYRRFMLIVAAIGYAGYLVYLATNGHTMLIDAFNFNTWQDALALGLYGIFTASLILVLAEPRSMANVMVPVAGFILLLASQFQLLYGPAGSPIGSPVRVVLFILWAPTLTFVFMGVPFLFVNMLRLLFDDLRAKKWRSNIKLSRPTVVTGIIIFGLFLPLTLGGLYAYKDSSLQILKTYQPLAESLNLGSNYIERSATSFNENQVKLVQTALAPCRDADGNLNSYYWVVFTLENENKDHFVNINGFINFLTSGGDVVGRMYFTSLSLPTDSKMIFVDPNALANGSVFKIEGGEYADTQLAITSVALGEPDQSTLDFNLKSELVSHQVNTNGLPRHTVVINVTNAAHIPIYHTQILAAVYNSSDELVDILWSERVKSWPVGKRLKPGESRDFALNSIAITGLCLGKPEFNGYKIEYYISGMTATGQTLGEFYSVETR
jgi:hypothetical protein